MSNWDAPPRESLRPEYITQKDYFEVVHRTSGVRYWARKLGGQDNDLYKVCEQGRDVERTYKEAHFKRSFSRVAVEKKKPTEEVQAEVESEDSKSDSARFLEIAKKKLNDSWDDAEDAELNFITVKKMLGSSEKPLDFRETNNALFALRSVGLKRRAKMNEAAQNEGSNG